MVRFLMLVVLTFAMGCKEKTSEDKPPPTATTAPTLASAKGDAGMTEKAEPPKPVELAVVSSDTTKTLDRKSLEALTESRVAKQRKLRGWLLADVVKLATDKSFTQIEVKDAKGESATITAAELASETFRATIRLNKRGLVRFGAWKLGGPEPISLHQLTDVKTITVTE